MTVESLLNSRIILACEKDPSLWQVPQTQRFSCLSSSGKCGYNPGLRVKCHTAVIHAVCTSTLERTLLLTLRRIFGDVVEDNMICRGNLKKGGSWTPEYS